MGGYDASFGIAEVANIEAGGEVGNAEGVDSRSECDALEFAAHHISEDERAIGHRLGEGDVEYVGGWVG